MHKTLEFRLLNKQADLRNICQALLDEEWVSFDTEFVGEKRFNTRLCLIQIASKIGNFLIDPFEIEDLSPFLDLIQSDQVLKITHAGENDYRLLYNNFGITPKHVYDTQIAAGFLGNKFPISFKKLVEKELDWPIDKGFTITNWEARPISKKQIQYALNDVLPLRDLYENQWSEIKKKQMANWVEEEFSALEKEQYYFQEPHREALNSNLMKSLKFKERLFLLRLMEWRRNTARDKDYSKEMVLPNKYLSHIVRGISGGKDILKQNRRIPNKIVERHWDAFLKMYSTKISDEESDLLEQIPVPNEEDVKGELISEFIYLVSKYKALEAGISIELLFPKSWLKAMREEPVMVSENIANSWRIHVMGKDLIGWIRKFPNLQIDFSGDTISIE